MELRPCYRQQWSDDSGYTDSQDLIGYMVVDSLGQTLAYGESREEAWENAMEAQWPISRESEGGMSAGAVVAR